MATAVHRERRGPTARQKFRVGDRVELTDLGRNADAVIVGRAHAGVVMGFGRRSPDLVRVRLDGQRQIGVFHQDYWHPVGRVGGSRKRR
jgi:hypothetical protein